ncbi:MAG: Tad domain-containing protein [Bdellovibrionaceae bacterium]|nr:Tad domain-containing protein [Pseudobdellovibrionaceae bacterium]
MLRVNPCSDKYKNQKGQISVFVGLTFLVLFTLFAMTINVGMIVHDKINVQNAVDFASLYVAQKQAEQLNAIAHMNYQIRQAHKLMTYRYIVLGTVGIRDNSDTAPGAVRASETKYDLADKIQKPACYASKELFTSVTNDNFCREERYAIRFSGIPHLTVINNRWGGNSSLRQTTINLGNKIERDTMSANAFDWWMASINMASYRIQTGYRRALIKALAENLSKPINAGGMKDLDGKSVFEGARKTFEYNLSESNKTTAVTNFQIRNSLQGLDRKQWLPEIKTWMALIYADRELGSTGGRGGVFEPINQRFNFELPRSWNHANAADAKAWVSRADPDGVLMSFTQGAYLVLPEDSAFEDVLGFEKNPWYMVYNQVVATTTSFALFSPTGGVSISARAFSKPFGGRIGPWYSKNWSSGSPISSGGKTVPLWSPRQIAAGQAPPQDNSISPNSPKYPGDQLGWMSNLGITSTGKIAGAGAKLHSNDYAHLVQSLLYNGGDGNAVAKNLMRDRELAAVAPDLFDIYYYSVDSNFHENYLHRKLDTWLVQEADFKEIPRPNPTIWRDIGFINTPANNSFSVHRQLRESTRGTYAPQIFYALETPDPTGRAHLLTSWVGGINVGEYRSPASGTVKNRFGKCKQFKASHPANVPGECLEDGGRTGYSVKMVSGDYLRSPNLSLGGNVGRILNPPE